MGLKMNGFWSTATLVALTAGLSAQTPAPQPGVATTQEKPTFKLQVDLVTSDIIVRDDKGNFIPDLKKDEFEIFEDGVKQDITSMTVVTGGRVTNVLAPPPPPPPEGIILPPTRPRTDVSGRIFLFFVDDLHLPFPNTDYIVRREYLQSHRAQVVSFMKAIIDGMRAIKANRTMGINAIQKYLKMNNAEEAGIAYDYYIGQHMGEFPEVPSRAALAAGIEQTLGKKEGVTPESLRLVDRSVLEELIKSGFVGAAVARQRLCRARDCRGAHGHAGAASIASGIARDLPATHDSGQSAAGA